MDGRTVTHKERLVAEYPTPGDPHLQLGNSLHNLAMSLPAGAAEAQAFLARAIAARRQAVALQPEPETWCSLASSLMNDSAGDAALTAESPLTEAIDLAAKAVRAAPVTRRYRSRLWDALESALAPDVRAAQRETLGALGRSWLEESDVQPVDVLWLRLDAEFLAALATGRGQIVRTALSIDSR